MLSLYWHFSAKVSFLNSFISYFDLIGVMAVRLVAFIIRAILAGSESAGESLGLFIADEVFFSTGFFGLLYGSYGLVMSR